jgi:hypothetical protein
VSSLFASIPYHLLEDEIIHSVIQLLSYLNKKLEKEDCIIPILSCYSSIFSTTVMVPEVMDYLLNNLHPPATLPPGFSTSHTTDILALLINTSLHASVPVRIQALTCSSRIGKHFPSIYRERWKVMLESLQCSFVHPDPHIRLHAVKVLEAVCKSSSLPKEHQIR